MAQIKTNLQYGVTGTIPTANIADDAITAAKLADDSVVAAAIADNAVVTAAINADAITAAKVADDVINSEHLVDGGIDDAHLATGIASSKLTGALPAISGASLTNLDARDLENALPAISGASLTNLSAGKVLQVSQKVFAAGCGVTTTSSFLYCSPMERGFASLASTSSKVYIIADGGRMGVANGSALYKFYGRTGSNSFASIMQYGMDVDTKNSSDFGTKYAPLSFSYLWSPNTTDSIDVQLWAKGSAGAEVNAADCQVFLTIMEIGG